MLIQMHLEGRRGSLLWQEKANSHAGAVPWPRLYGEGAIHEPDALLHADQSQASRSLDAFGIATSWVPPHKSIRTSEALACLTTLTRHSCARR
jgi:hypothetical protein